mgnify:FL=1
MRVVISAGGTGGHIYPALAIINKIKELEKDSEFLYIGTHNRMEKDIVPKYGIPFEPIEMYGLDRKNILNNFKTLFCLIKANIKCRKLIKKFDPDVVIGCGGYITYPVIKAAKKLKIKTFIHEQNSVAGLSNLKLSKYADLIGVSFKSTIDDFKHSKVVFTGNPCSENALVSGTQNKSEFGIPEDKRLILFVMGSLGASKVNDTLVETLPLIGYKNYYALFVTGNAGYESIKNLSFPKNVVVVPYIENMTRIMKNVDLMVTRAGASTLSEIIALRVPSILIPSPYVPNNHQYKNALNLVNNKAALMIEEKNLTCDTLINTIDSVINDTVKLNDMKTRLNKLNVEGSAGIIYKNIRALIDGKM